MPGYRPSRIRRLLALIAVMTAFLFVIIAPPIPWAFNAVPFASVPPDDSDRQHCDEDFGYGSYHFSALGHRWVRTDNWLFLIDDAGIYGV